MLVNELEGQESPNRVDNRLIWLYTRQKGRLFQRKVV